MKGYEEDSDDDDDYEDVTAGDAMENTFVHEMGEFGSMCHMVLPTNTFHVLLGHVFGLQHEHQRSDRRCIRRSVDHNQF